jgi:cytochrome P450
VQAGFVTSKIFYNIFLHPLRSFPGPFLGRATLIEYQRQLLKGYNHLWIQSLHKKYGPVVRISPNVLSFIEPEVWKDVYGHKATSFTKDVQYFYGPDAYGNPPGLIRADNVNHARQRKLVSHAFSDKALKEQEHLLKGYVNTMVDQLKKISTVKDGDKIDLVKWYNFTTFDIMVSASIYQTYEQDELTLNCLWPGRSSLW